METTVKRKFHPAIEILLIAVLNFAFELIKGYGMTLFLMVAGSNNTPSFISVFHSIFSIISYLLTILAALLCVKVIEKRSIHILGLILISLGAGILVSFIGSIFSRFVIRFDGMQLAVYSSVTAFVFPLMKAILITLFVNLFDKNQSDSQDAQNIMYCNLFVHILLLLFTFGIWRLVWIYRITQYSNSVIDEKYRNPTAKLLLCMFVPFYSIYWTYQSAQRVDKLANSAGLVSDLAVTCLILEIFVPIIPPILMQDKINKILTSK